MNKTHKQLITIIMLLFMSLPAFAQLHGEALYAGPPPDYDERPHHRFRGHHSDRRPMCFGDNRFMKEELKMTDDQIQKIGDINLKYRKRLLEHREKLQPRRTRLKRLLLEKKVDLAEIEKILTSMSETEVQIRLDRIKQRIEIEQLLTPEQRQRLKEINREKHRRGMMDDDRD